MADYERMLENFYSQINLKDSLVLDIGAHNGRHAIPLSVLVGDGAVYAFEPVPQIRKQLVDQLYQKSINNVVVYPFALSSEKSTGEFNFIPNLPEEGGLKKRHQYNAPPVEFQKIHVQICKLDDLIWTRQKVSFVKIDVEGAELDVLEGSLLLLERDTPIVAFECGASSFLGYHNTPEKIYDLFSKFNYSIYSILGDQLTNYQAFVSATHEQRYWDFIALPSQKLSLSKLLKP